MEVTTAREGAHLIVGVDGRVDGVSAPEFQAAIEGAIQPSDQAVIVDMGGVQFIASAGLRVLLVVGRLLQKQNAKLVACSLSERLREVFTISGFSSIVPLYDSRADALQALND
ncbi:MAG: STAS domain-containing protein [Chloroflexota bacterium]|nr:STAS domain-containing protein [Chloroflexota bacterium]MDE2883659.1 STAS domain-containing protein [Chloroflexota bacterium]